ncbi:hypothetical protein G6714_07520 [Polynucleobacter paneuropaeus]|nr:hypothetical protein [Polynucleobacter paneuropaeus]
MAKDKAQKAYQKGTSRDGGGFVALPWSVLDCAAYRTLSHPAKSLLMEFSRQYVKDNNGRLLASTKFLKNRGWNSADVIHRAKLELVGAGLIYETVKGHRPNKASWYAITWQNLDKDSRYDAGAWEGWKHVRSGYKNTALIPPNGTKVHPIGPANGVTVAPTIPLDGTIKPSNCYLSIPLDGNHLELPSTLRN